MNFLSVAARARRFYKTFKLELQPLTALFLVMAAALHADVGIVVYQSKGVDARRTSTGHLALVATRLCADGIDAVRLCKEGEQPGVAVTRYAGMAYGHPDWFVFTLPLKDYLNASTTPDDAPVLSSGATLEALQIAYWRSHLRTNLPPLTQQQYESLKADSERFDARRTLGKAVTFELVVQLLMPHKKRYATEPFALIDPLTNEMIPNGRWREAIGATHTRSSILMTAPASMAQEQRLISFISGVQHQSFQAMTSNCSDFSKGALLAVFSDSGLHFHRRMANVADAFISSPLDVATEFIRFAERTKTQMAVTPIPIMAGTRFPTAEITSVTRGALVPNPQQGKLAFGIKAYVNWLNPYIGLTAYSLDKLARFADLRQLVHERGSSRLAELTALIKTERPVQTADLTLLHREQFKVFGTTTCWKQKQDEFMNLTHQATEFEILTAEEQALLLKPGRPYLLPRLYEMQANVHSQPDHPISHLSSGVPSVDGKLNYTATASLSEHSPSLNHSVLDSPQPVPGRMKIAEMSASLDPAQRRAAFQLMTAVINYDLSLDSDQRRSADKFDADWALFLAVSAKVSLHLPVDPSLTQTVADCSCRQFDSGSSSRDAFSESQRPAHQLARNFRTLFYGPAR